MTKRIFIVFGCLMLGPGFAYSGPVTSEPDADGAWPWRSGSAPTAIW